MAKEVLVTDILSQEMIQAGASLVAQLDDRGLRVEAAWWRYHEEGEVWRLVVALPGIDLYGPRKAYEQIQSVLRNLPEEESTIGLEHISVVDSEGTLVRELQNRVGAKILHTPKAVPYSRMALKDAFVYRL